MAIKVNLIMETMLKYSERFLTFLSDRIRLNVVGWRNVKMHTCLHFISDIDVFLYPYLPMCESMYVMHTNYYIAHNAFSACTVTGQKLSILIFTTV